jgi:hypothetical protein
MMIRHARHIAIVAALVVASSGAFQLTPANAAPNGQSGAEAPDVLGAPPPAVGEPGNLNDCGSTVTSEPWGRSPAIAEGDLGAAEGPGTAGSGGAPNLSANPDCPLPSPLPPT